MLSTPLVSSIHRIFIVSIIAHFSKKSTPPLPRPLPRWAVRDRCHGGQSAQLTFDNKITVIAAL